jgi:hypothetical protein
MQFCRYVRNRRQLALLTIAACVTMLASFSAQTQAQDEKPVPLLTGGIGYFTNVEAGQTQLVPVFAPVLLAPLGDRWLFESRAEFSGEFLPQNGTLSGRLDNEVDYAQIDYIANPYLTITAGRFLTPFGIYNERLYPVWIRKLENFPIIFPIGSGSSDGVMLRGGFPLSSKANLNYAAYFSTLSNINKLDSDRLTGGRVGVFLPGPRIELGTSFQQLLQEDRSRSVGFHFGWQPNRVPLNVRSEYAWSGSKGNGYWVESAYTLSQVTHWQHALRRLELVGRGQQYFPGNLQSDDAEEYGLPLANTRQGDFGVNYYLRDGLKATASYGREFNSLGNANIWTFGLAYRFLMPLGRTGVK